MLTQETIDFLEDAVVKSTKTFKNPGYHKTPLPKGQIGQISKVIEELLEFEDAELQGSRIMMALELSDALLAIDLIIRSKLPEWTIYDLIHMAEITNRAFESGQRKPKP